MRDVGARRGDSWPSLVRSPVQRLARTYSMTRKVGSPTTRSRKRATLGCSMAATASRLVLEAQAELGIGEQLRLEQLDRHAHADGDVLGEEDLAHGAVSDRTHHAIALADDVAGFDCRRICVGEAFGQRLELREALRERRRLRRFDTALTC